MIFRRSWLQESFLDLRKINNQDLMEACRKMGISVTLAEDTEDPLFTAEPPKNRQDLFSLQGLAREAGAALNLPLKSLSLETDDSGQGNIFSRMDIDVPAESVLRYSVRMAVNCKNTDSPGWLSRRLQDLSRKSAGVFKNIAAWVQAETGQAVLILPLSKIVGESFTVRDSFSGEFISLSGEEMTVLPEGIPLISDENGQALAVSGIQVPVPADCPEVLICCPCYDPSLQEKLSSLLPHQDLSAYAPSDPLATIDALDRVCSMIETLNVGQILEGTLDNLNYVPQPRVLSLKMPQSICEPLALMGFQAVPEGTLIPSFRQDIRNDSDLLKEFSRLENAFL